MSPVKEIFTIVRLADNRCPQFKKILDRLKKISLTLSLLIPVSSYATSGDTPVSQGLGYITDALTGNTGIMIATLAIMGVGLGCLLHKIEWKMFAYTVAAIGIVFGANGIAKAIQGLVH